MEMTDNRDSQQAIRQAAERLVDRHRQGGSIDRLSADPAVARVREVWDDAAGLSAHPDYADLMGSPTWRERIVSAWRELFRPIARGSLTPAHVVLAAACLVLIAVGIGMTRSASPEYRTQIAEVRELILPDGSQLTLGAKSEIAKLAFSSGARRVQMGVGEAFFSVAKNPARPFFVQAGGTLIRVVGTKFNVKYDGDQVKVSVLEGMVQVIRPTGAAESVTSATGQPHVTLTAGQQTVVLETEPGFTARVAPIQGAAPGDWREGRLSYEDAPLSEVIADANRYRSGAITIASPTLAGERINTSFKTSQVDQMLETLPDSVNAQIVKHPDGTVEIRAK